MPMQKHRQRRQHVFRCKSLTGPKGQSMLNVRVWVCSECKTEHKRDENSSKHIGERGMLILYPTSWEKPYTRAEASASIEACSIEQAKPGTRTTEHKFG